MKVATLLGNVGRKPIINQANGTTYSNFSVAVNDRNRNGEEVTEWYHIVAFGKLAETLARVEAGDELLIHGPFRQTSYTTQNGVAHCDLEIKAWTIAFLRRKGRGRLADAPPAAAGHAGEPDGAPAPADLPDGADGAEAAASGTATNSRSNGHA